jgi:hypothetical protein
MIDAWLSGDKPMKLSSDMSSLSGVVPWLSIERVVRVWRPREAQAISCPKIADLRAQNLANLCPGIADLRRFGRQVCPQIADLRGQLSRKCLKCHKMLLEARISLLVTNRGRLHLRTMSFDRLVYKFIGSFVFRERHVLTLVQDCGFEAQKIADLRSVLATFCTQEMA